MSRIIRNTEIVAEYVTRARQLARRFPALKKYTKRRTLKSYEAGHITRLSNVAKLVEDTNIRQRRELFEDGEIQEWMVSYTFPGDRIKSDKAYKDILRDRLEFATPETAKTIKKIIRQRTKLKPWQKGYASKIKKALSFVEDQTIIPVTKEQADKLPKDIVRGYGADHKGTGQGVYAIKLLNQSRKTIKDIQIIDGDMIVREFHYIYVYRHIPISYIDDGFDAVTDAFSQAAQAAFDNGAKAVWFWTNNGMAGGGHRTYKQFMNSLRADYMRYLDESETEGRDTDWLHGIAIEYENTAERRKQIRRVKSKKARKRKKAKSKKR